MHRAFLLRPALALVRSFEVRLSNVTMSVFASSVRELAATPGTRLLAGTRGLATDADATRPSHTFAHVFVYLLIMAPLLGSISSEVTQTCGDTFTSSSNPLTYGKMRLGTHVAAQYKSPSSSLQHWVPLGHCLPRPQQDAPELAHPLPLQHVSPALQKPTPQQLPPDGAQLALRTPAC